MHHHAEMYRRLLGWMALLAVPVLLTDPKFAHLIGYDLPPGPIRWVAPVLGTVIYIVGGRPFLSGARDEIARRRPGMMLLISLGITVAFVSSMAATLGLLPADLQYWWELALLVVVMLLGHWLEMRSLAATSSALDSLAALLPDDAERVVPASASSSRVSKTELVSPGDLQPGDVVLVRPGATVPADGEIVDGTADLDESMVTGESRPVTRTVGEAVVAGTVATDSNLHVRVTATGDDTVLAGIQRLVAQAQSSTTPTQRLADRAAGWLFWYALAAAAITAAVWLALGRPEDAVARTISVLVIACPHALGLAIPLVVAIATERAARAGVLISDRVALETSRHLSAVLMDKTGTLTEGEPQLTEVAASDEVLAWAAAAESASEHPLARAIVSEAHERGLRIPVAHEVSSRPAVGVAASVEGHSVEVGGPALLAEAGLNPLPQSRSWSDDGATVLHTVVDGGVRGALRLSDAVRPESRAAVRALQDLDIEVAMITGDAQAVADSVARGLGITRVFAQVRPQDKAERVKELQGEGKIVAMVGDGVNDAPALAQSDVGMAIGAGTDVAIASAGVVLASSDPRSVVSVIELSRAAYRKMTQNLWWAAGYNLVAVPLAAGVLAPIGFVLPMSVGALLMSASTVIVALNAQTLRQLDLSGPAAVKWAEREAVAVA